MRTRLKIFVSFISLMIVFSMVSLAASADSSGSGVGCTYTFTSDGVLNVRCNDRIVTILDAVNKYRDQIKTVNLDISGISLNTAVEIYGNDCEATAVNVVGRSSGTYEKFSLMNFPYAYDVSIPTGVTFSTLRLSNVGVKNLNNIKNINVKYFFLRDCDYLTSVTFPLSTYQAEVRDCSRLKTIVANDGLKIMNLM